MECVHVRNLEKYHPGYKDRELQWGKIFINMADGDPDCELIKDEIDWARFIKMILLELRAKKPLPNLDEYWLKKGFNIKKRPMSLTLQMLHNFISIVETSTEECVLDKEKSREDKEEKRCVTHTNLSDESFIKNLKKTYDYADVDNEFLKMDAWISVRPGRKKTRRFIVNWLNKIDKPVKTLSLSAPIKNEALEKIKGWKKELKIDLKEVNKLLKDTTEKIGGSK